MSGGPVSAAPFPALRPGSRLLLFGLPSLLLFATVGEGGGSAASLLIWHAGLVFLVLWRLLAPRPDGALGGIPAPAPLVAVTLFLVLAAAGAALAPGAYSALLTGIEIAACFAVFLLAADLGPGLIRLLRWPLGLGAAAQAALSIWQRIAQGEARPAGSFLNTNHMACWLVLVLLLLIGGLPEMRSAGARRLATLLAGLAGLAVLLSGSRGALLALIVGGAWLLSRRWRGIPRAGRAVLLVAVALLLAAAGWRVAQRLREPDPFRYQRVTIWTASLQVFLEDPWWGSGPGQFPVTAKRFQFPDDDGALSYDRRFAIPHSEPLRALAEFGAPAALALLCALGLAAAELRRRRGSRGAAGDGAVAALLAVGTQALVDNPSRWPAVYLLVCALLGSLLSAPRDPGPVRMPPAWRAGLAALLVLFFVVGDLGPTVAHFAFVPPTGRVESAEDARARLQRDLDLALRLNPLHPVYWKREAEALSGGADWGTSEYAGAREAAERAVRLQPRDSDFAWALARVEARACIELYRDAGTRDRALRAYARARELYPTDPRIVLDEAVFRLGVADPRGARRLAEAALRLEPNAVPARLILAEALLDAGSPDGPARAAALLREARALAARWEATAREGVYQRELLALDARAVSRIESRLAAESAAGPR
jgi:O-antigen ligase